MGCLENFQPMTMAGRFGAGPLERAAHRFSEVRKFMVFPGQGLEILWRIDEIYAKSANFTLFTTSRERIACGFSIPITGTRPAARRSCV